VERYLEDNRASWDDRAAAHAASPDYGLESFVNDPSFLSYVVQFDTRRLGDISGLRGVHLQCHIGTDTISLARLGAQMTGVDLSPASLAQARQLATQLGADVTFVEAEVYDAAAALGGQQFELVYTGIGALCWLPSIRRWAEVVSELLAPGGRLFIREGHPMLWAIDEERQEGLVVDYPYFETDEAIVADYPGTYVSTEATFTHNTNHNWNHGLGELFTAVMDAGLEITSFAEHDSIPWEAIPGRMERIELKEWRLKERPSRLACSYTLQAVKR
jgi:SAM-dependent methyltransferase